ncbi:MAG: PAS domain-containing protein, partial [Candidatus Saccharicenans sp.]
MTIEPLRDAFDQVVGVTTVAFDVIERKQVELQLRLSEERFRLATEASQAVIYDLTMGREELNQSEGLEYLVGYKPGEEPGGSRDWWPSNIHPDDKPRVMRELQEAIDSGGDSYAYEYRIRHAEGHWVHVWDQGHILRDENGNPVRIVGSAKNITERIKAEEKLRQSEKRFRELADAMPQLVWTAQPDGTVDYYNARSQEYFGIAETGEGNWDWSTPLHPDDLERTMTAWKHSLETGEVYRCEHRVKMADGTYRWHLSRALPARGPDGTITRWYGAATDIHETKMVEEKLRDRNERLAILSQAANELLGGEDPLVLLSRLYERLSGLFGVDTFIYYNLNEAGNGLELAAQGGWPESVVGAIGHVGLGQGICGQVAVEGKTITVDEVQKDTRTNTRVIRAAGINAYVCFPLFVHDRLIGTVSFGSYSRTKWEPEVLKLLRTVCDLVATAVDRARTEVELQRYADQLERSNRDLQEFAFVASHDLQEPLRKIEAFGAALIELSDNLTDKQIDYLGRMRNAAARMRIMVDDLLALSRVNRQTQPFQPIDLNQILQEVISDLEM